MTEYINPFRTKDQPRTLQCDTAPDECHGFLVYHRIRTGAPYAEGRDCFDVVLNGVCVAQYAGPNGARGFIDNLVGPELARIVAMSKGATEWRYAPNRLGMRDRRPPLVYFTCGLLEVGYWCEVSNAFKECPREWGEAIARGHITKRITTPLPESFGLNNHPTT